MTALKSTGFSPYINFQESDWALAPEGFALPKLNHRRFGTLPRLLFAIAMAPAILFTACHSYHIDTTIENRTGADIQLLEVDYPSASFGADRIASGAVYHYRFQVNGSGPLKIEYTTGDGKQVQIDGPTLVERQQGQLKIVLVPAGKAQFLPQLTPPS
jgi:hypothetical protein